MAAKEQQNKLHANYIKKGGDPCLYKYIISVHLKLNVPIKALRMLGIISTAFTHIRYIAYR